MKFAGKMPALQEHRADGRRTESKNLSSEDGWAIAKAEEGFFDFIQRRTETVRNATAAPDSAQNDDSVLRGPGAWPFLGRFFSTRKRT